MTSTSARPVARITRSVDLVATVPELLGFRARESLVVLAMHEPRGRLGLTMRFDLDAPTDLAAEVVLRLRQDGATRAALVLYTDAPGARPCGTLVLTAAERLRAAGVRVTEALLVRGERWWSYLCDDDCCPEDGTPVLDGSSGPAGLVAAERVLAGKVLYGSREELLDSLRPVLPLGEGLRLTQLAAADRDLLEACLDDRQAAVRRETARALGWLERGTDPGADECARLAVALRLHEVRDALSGEVPDRPDDVEALMRSVLRWTPHVEAGPVLQLLGTALYATGAGALARAALEAAVAADGPEAFAQVLLDALDGQVPPSRVRQVLRQTRRTAA